MHCSSIFFWIESTEKGDEDEEPQNTSEKGGRLDGVGAGGCASACSVSSGRPGARRSQTTPWIAQVSSALASRTGASALPFPFSSCFVFHRARRFCDGVEGRRRPRRWGGAGDGGEAPASAWSARARGGAGASAGDGGEAPARGTAAVRRGCAGVRCVCRLHDLREKRLSECLCLPSA